MSGEKCHSSTPEIEIKKGTTVVYHQCAPAISQYGDTNEMMILELDNCGNLLKKSDKDATNTPVTEKSSWSTTSPIQVNLNDIKIIYQQAGPGYSGAEAIQKLSSHLEPAPIGQVTYPNTPQGKKYNVYKIKASFQSFNTTYKPGQYIVFTDGVGYTR